MTAPTHSRVGAYVFPSEIENSIQPRRNHSHRAGCRVACMVISNVLPDSGVLIFDQAFQHCYFVLEHFKIAHSLLHVLQFRWHGTQNHIRRLCCQRTDSSLMFSHFRFLLSHFVVRSCQPLLDLFFHASTVPFVVDCLHDTDYGLFSHIAKQLCKDITASLTLCGEYHA